MLGIGKELSIFVSACLTGNFICLIYFCLMVFRRIVKHNLFWISIEDIFFWIGSGGYLFGEMYRTCNGSICWYFVLGVFLGMLITLLCVQKLKKELIKRKKRGKIVIE